MNNTNEPKWLDNAVFYEIYPQSFNDTNADGIGDINGITEKLDYIKDLGCNAIWINPCFKSPFGDAGYDVEDYYMVASRYGTNEDLANLFKEAHKRDMHILLDLVPGHTSVQHEWFKQSMKAEKNEFTDRYVWTDSIWEEPQGMGCIRGISDRDGSCAVNFFSHQPALNYGYYKPERPWQQSMDDEGPKATLEAMKDVMRFWLQMGADGFRVDMAGSLVKNDEDGKGTIKLWQNVREFLDKEFPNAAMVSEWGEPDKSLQGGFHMDFLLHFGPSHYNDLFRCEEPFFSSRGKGDVSAFVEKYLENYEKSEKKGLMCIPSGNHDMGRLSQEVKGDELKVAFAFLLSMPGAPFIYYGDEIGMKYQMNLPNKEGSNERSGTRTPMQWTKGKNAGFSTSAPDKLYFPVDTENGKLTVEAQQGDQNSLLSYTRKLTALRHSAKALDNEGDWKLLNQKGQEYPMVYERTLGDEKYVVIVNPGAKAASLNISSVGGKSVSVLSTGKVVYKSGKKTDAIKASGISAAVFKVAK